jgi:hypothetical protein
MTHHNGLLEGGAETLPLWNEVMKCFPAGATPAYWNWGHVHIGAAYATQPNGVQCRCAGYGALPYGSASELVGTRTCPGLSIAMPATRTTSFAC